MNKKLFILILSILFAPSILISGVPNEINYQGRLRESDVGVTGNRTFKFNIYDAESGGNILWTSNDQVIFVSSGTFNYTLTPSVDWRKQDLWIETLVSGSILLPRQKITSSAYSLHAETAEGITKNNGQINLVIGSDTSLLDIENNQLKCLTVNTTFYMIPKGFIGMWSGNIGNIPDGWALCNGTNGTPDLRGRFIVAFHDSINDYSAIGYQGGEETHVLTIDEIPQHNHINTASTMGGMTGVNFAIPGATGVGFGGVTGGGAAHENRPPYYVLAFIMKL